MSRPRLRSIITLAAVLAAQAPRPGHSVRDLGLRWSTSGPIAGMSCTPITEPVDPYTWNDNYLCAPSSLGFAWSSAGRIAGKRCTQFLEPGDPHTWSDNYLCHSLRTSARRW